VLVDGPPAGADRRLLSAHPSPPRPSPAKLACLFWCLLTSGEDYAYAQPSLTQKKMRRLELQAGAPRRQGGRHVWSTNDAMRNAERALAEQAELAYKRNVADWQATRRQRRARVRHRGTHLKRPRRAKAARQTTAPDVCVSLRQSPAPTTKSPTRQPAASRPLDFLSDRVGASGRWRPAWPVGPRVGDGLTH
jgi:hypothetical protein